MMERLTKKDWRTINAALAAYEAEDWQEVFGWSDEQTAADEMAVANARRKVHQRLNDDDLRRCQLMTTDDHCCNCGAGPDVHGGLELTEAYDWICRDDLGCIRRAGKPAPELNSINPEARAQAIDADYQQRKNQ